MFSVLYLLLIIKNKLIQIIKNPQYEQKNASRIIYKEIDYEK